MASLSSWGPREEHTSGRAVSSLPIKREAGRASSAVLPARKRIWMRVFCFPSTLLVALHAHLWPEDAAARPEAGAHQLALRAAGPGRRGPAHSRRPPRAAPVAVETKAAKRRGGFRSSAPGRAPADRDAEGQDPVRGALRGEARAAGAAGGARAGAGATRGCAWRQEPPRRREPRPPAPTRCAPLASAGTWRPQTLTRLS